jgi:hypothetical protein
MLIVSTCFNVYGSRTLRATFLSPYEECEAREAADLMEIQVQRNVEMLYFLGLT